MCISVYIHILYKYPPPLFHVIIQEAIWLGGAIYILLLSYTPSHESTGRMAIRGHTHDPLIYDFPDYTVRKNISKKFRDL